jgi:hypothetical protein
MTPGEKKTLYISGGVAVILAVIGYSWAQKEIAKAIGSAGASGSGSKVPTGPASTQSAPGLPGASGGGLVLQRSGQAAAPIAYQYIAPAAAPGMAPIP